MPKLDDVLQNTWNYVDSEKYLSWERFFTDYLERGTEQTPFHYTKSKLNKAYLSPVMQKAILKNTPVAFLLEEKKELLMEKDDTKESSIDK